MAQIAKVPANPLPVGFITAAMRLILNNMPLSAYANCLPKALAYDKPESVGDYAIAQRFFKRIT